MSQWTSDAFHLYIQIPKERLAQVSSLDWQSYLDLLCYLGYRIAFGYRFLAPLNSYPIARIFDEFLQLGFPSKSMTTG